MVFGDYQPLSDVTVDRKYFTSDPIFFQEIFKSIVCMKGGIIKNAVEEGMVAALEVHINATKRIKLPSKTNKTTTVI